MNKKGFTLVELLATIVILGLILVITMTNGLGIFNKAKGGINKIEEDNLIEAAKVFLVDVDNGFITTFPSGCNKNSFFNGNSCDVSVSYIINNYMTTVPKGCNENLFLRLKIDYIDKDGDSEVDEIDYLAIPVDSSGNETIICTK